MQNFMELNMKKKFNLKTVTFEVWDLKTNFWQFTSKSLIEPQVQNSGFNFQNLEDWNLKTNFGSLGPKTLNKP